MPRRGVRISCLCGNQQIVKSDSPRQYQGVISLDYDAHKPCICDVGKRRVQATSVTLNTMNAR